MLFHRGAKSITFALPLRSLMVLGATMYGAANIETVHHIDTARIITIAQLLFTLSFKPFLLVNDEVDILIDTFYGVSHRVMRDMCEIGDMQDIIQDILDISLNHYEIIPNEGN